MIKTYRYRLYPTKNQEKILDKTLNLCCWLYNSALQERVDIYKKYKKSITCYYQINELPNCKKEIPELDLVFSQVLQDVIKRLDKAYQSFFKRIQRKEKSGFPRFRSRSRFDSFCYPQGGFKFVNGKLRLGKIGDIKLKLHREFEGKVKTCTIKKDIDRWYACFSVEVENEILLKTGREIGVDVGINNFAVLSDGNIIENPKFLKKSEKRLRRRQRKLSSKQKGSQNRNKQRVIVAKQHRKIREQRKDFQHKESRKIVNNYDLIVFEDLRILNMMKNHKLAKSISDASWGQFINFVSHKAEYAGKEIKFVDPRNTSIICSGCGEKVPKTLADRIHCCSHCGLEIDRDLNASINILRKSTVGITGFKAWGEILAQVDSMNQEAYVFRRR
jgi:putative transposase